MVNNTVQTLIDELKDASGQSSISTAKAIRALNRGVDSLSMLSLIASGSNKNDSRNHGDISRVTATVTSGTTKVLLEGEVMTLQQMDILINGKYQRLEPIDRRDNGRTPLDTTYGTGTPTHYDREGNHAYLYPVPNATFTLRLTYGRPHPRFTAANLTQETGMLPLHEDYVVMFAVDRVMISTNDPSKAGVRNDLVILRKDVIDSFKNQDEDRPRRLTVKLNSTFSKR